MWTLLQDIEQAWSLADVSSDSRVGPLKLSTTISADGVTYRAMSSVHAIIGNIRQFRVATTCTSALGTHVTALQVMLSTCALCVAQFLATTRYNV